MSETESANNGVYFLSLELENVRCFGKKQKLDLSDGKGNPAQWTVILGDNGRGKTTLLQIIARMEFVKHTSDIDNFPNLGFPPEKFEVFQLIHKIAEYSLKEDYRYDASFVRSNEKAPRVNFYFGIGKLTNINTTGEVGYTLNNSGKMQGKFFPDMEISKKLLALKTIAYGATRRLSKSSLYIKGNEDFTATLFDEKAKLIDIEEWMLRKDYASSKDSPIQSKTKKQLDLIKSILKKKLLPDIDDIEISAPTEKQPSPILRFKTPFGWIRLESLSLGYQTMITWIVDLVVCLFERYPDSPNPIAEPAVVLIDEIDLHLHPKWQREIMRYLSERFTNTQFIVTAHSPLIVQAAEDENANIVVLRREGDEVIIDQQPKAIHGWRVDQLLASDLFGLEGVRSPKNEKLLKDRRAILSKGELTEADKIKLEELEEKIGDLPTAETITHIKAMDIIERAAKLLEAAK